MAAEGLNINRGLKIQTGEDPVLLEMTMITLKKLLPNLPTKSDDETLEIIMSAIEYIDYLKATLKEM